MWHVHVRKPPAVARCSRSCWLRCYEGWTTLQLWNRQLHETRAQFLILLKDWFDRRFM